MIESKKLVVPLIILIVLILLYIGSMVLKTKTESDTTTNQISQQDLTTDESTLIEEPENATLKFKYELLSFYKGGNPEPNQSYDGQIIQTDIMTGKKTTVVKSIKTAYPALKENQYKSFIQLNQSTTKPYLYLGIVYYAGDAPIGGIVRYDGDANKFTELKISKNFNSFTSTASKESAYAASIYNVKDGEDTRSLFLLDFDGDTIKSLATLPSNETFNLCEKVGCLMPSAPDIEWLSGDTFRISIFDPEKVVKDKNGNETQKLIETRKFIIK